MKIEYKDADGRVMELDVSDEIGQFYLSSVEEAEKSDRRNTRTFSGYHLRLLLMWRTSGVPSRHISTANSLLPGLSASICSNSSGVFRDIRRA